MNGLLLIAALLPGALIRQTITQIRFIRKLKRVGREAEATVISQREVPVGRGSKRLTPRVEYWTLGGEQLVGESRYKAGEVDFFDGDIALIVYDPDKPTDFLLYQELHLGQRYTLLGFSAVMLIVAVGAAMQ